MYGGTKLHSLCLKGEILTTVTCVLLEVVRLLRSCMSFKVSTGRPLDVPAAVKLHCAYSQLDELEVRLSWMCNDSS